MKMEMNNYNSDANSLLVQTEAEKLSTFSLPKLAQEFWCQLPTLMQVVCNLINRRNTRNMNKEVIAATIVAKILGVHNQRLSAFKYITGIIMDVGGAKDTCIERLQKTGESVTSVSLRKKIGEMSSLTRNVVKDWDVPTVGSSLVFDNVNPYVKPRHQTSKRGNKLYSMTHALMIKDRVPTSSFSNPPSKTIGELIPCDVLPNESDKTLIENCFTRVLCNVWAENIDSFKWMAREIPKHKNFRYTRKKTEFINLGVMMKDETKIAELLEILKYYHTFVPKTKNGKLDPKLCFGDHLSHSNGKLAQDTQADVKDPEGRLEGLIMALSDFHAMTNLLDATFKTSFTADSTRSVGTLSHAKVYLNLSNAGSRRDSHKKYYDSSELADKVFHAYVITELLDRFMMDSQGSECPLPHQQCTREKATHIAQEFIDNYVDLSLPGDKSEDNTKMCPHCCKVYKTTRGLTNHLEKVHPNEPEMRPRACGGDGVLSYTIHYNTLSLLRMTLKEAVRAANGIQVMAVYKYMFMICKAVGNYNYANGLVETLMQLKILPEKLAESLTWNRFCNTRGKLNSNLPIDLFMEHANKYFKELLSTYRGEFTQASLDRISKSQSVIEAILRDYDEATHHKSRKFKGTNSVNEEDVKKLVKLYRPAKLFANLPGRQHSPDLVFTRRNVMKSLAMDEVQLWLHKKFKFTKGSQYYKQFDTSIAAPEDSLILSELEASFNDSLQLQM